MNGALRLGRIELSPLEEKDAASDIRSPLRRSQHDRLREYVLLLIVMSALLAGCAKKHSGDEEEGESTSPAVVAVRTAPISRGTIDVAVTATGKTDALRKEKIFSPIAGKILSVKVFEGTAVKTGDLLATIETKESHAAISGAEALMKSARTPKQAEDARRMLALAESTQSVVNVRARFDGIVSSRIVSDGELISENGEIVTVLDLSSLIFTADVMLRDLPEIRIGQASTIRFQALNGRRFAARVDAINPESDLQSQTVRVRLRFVNVPMAFRSVLKIDMAGSARIVTGAHEHVLLVPKSALLRNDEAGTYSVTVATADSLAKSIPVTIGAATDSTVEVSGGGLEAGMHVIVEGNYALTDSTKVTVLRSVR